MVANLLFAWVNAHASREAGPGRHLFLPWLETTIEEVLALFVEKWNALLRECATEPVARHEGFGQWHLQQVLADAAGIAGLELCRRIVGIAQVRDITGILDPRVRTRAERACLRAAKRFIFDRDHVRSGGDFLAIMRDTALEEALA